MGGSSGLLTAHSPMPMVNATALTIVVPPLRLSGCLNHVRIPFHEKRYLTCRRRAPKRTRRRATGTSKPDQVPVLQVQGLNVSYGNLQVLFDVDIEVKRGETLALLGTNGAGKSTALKRSRDCTCQTGGRRMNGRDITLVDPEYRYRLAWSKYQEVKLSSQDKPLERT
ncbi:MAG: hypothetical protein CM15mP49_22680 [Actinomycetota bacterium]|nr:MAG: hypothetical protein CM15mP49_22680 [Actinomycetota bacterium]